MNRVHGLNAEYIHFACVSNLYKKKFHVIESPRSDRIENFNEFKTIHLFVIHLDTLDPVWLMITRNMQANL